MGGLATFLACLSDLTHRRDNEILIMYRLAASVSHQSDAYLSLQVSSMCILLWMSSAPAGEGGTRKRGGLLPFVELLINLAC